MSEQQPNVAPPSATDPLDRAPLPGATQFMREYVRDYPEVVRAGSLQSALQAEADRGGHELTIELTASPGWRRVAAKAEADGRSTYVLMARDERLFLVDCWTHGIQMASGSTQDLSEVAGAMQSWLRTSEVREFVEQWTFLRTWELAEAHERGEAIPARWRVMRKHAAMSAAREQRTDWWDLVEAAFEQPRLRALSPGRAMYWFTLSRRAAPPVCHDLPRARPLGDGRFEVRFADGRLQEVNGATTTIATILDGLPDDAAP
ncbi:hypothetical protein EAO73_26125 [Streptomyces sp. col6]|uniref:DUF6193 family natural product biosynthesis protein n=1 Tax=Streptomyces sp. col6 TaxID=2478958 RepID=UPI0011CE9F3D|nr:DUF6193 family natural product biosynthesis protein [Streptomyces sp. col6]TXS00706.1 hypothetical protein EAO73_26125 [Streptomyces sp. col6]